jgi:hypothetical protein
VDADERGFRVALVADEYVNPPPGGLEALPVLAACGWGAIQLPPAWYPDDVAAPLLVEVAEHVEEFERRGYAVVLVGSRAGLAEGLGALGLALPDAVVPAGAAELEAFLGRAGAPSEPAAS